MFHAVSVKKAALDLLFFAFAGCNVLVHHALMSCSSFSGMETPRPITH
uniref:Uncharacterized protein n=1 Tax=Setaria italica TaxID=4555 RepID=K3Y416_SETIT